MEKASDPALKFTDLFDLNKIQVLQDDFSTANGVASVITHVDGTPITKPSNFTRLCQCNIRGTEKGLLNCIHSDADLGDLDPSGPHVQQCLSAGLWDAGAGIHVNGQHIANWLIGQVRDSTQKEDQILAYAEEIGADPEETLQAFREVPEMSREKFASIARLLYTLASQLSQLAVQNVLLRNNLKEQKKIQNDLNLSRKKYRDLAETTPDWLWEMDTQGKFTYTSPRVKDLLGYEPEEFIGKKCFDIMPPEDVEKMKAGFLEVVKNKLPFSNILNINLHKEGHRVFLETSGIPFFNESGELVGYRGVDRNISQRYRAEKEARTFKAIAEQAGYGVMISDLDLNINYVNISLAEMLHSSKEELEQRNLQSLIPPENLKAVNKQFIKLLRNKSLNGLEIEMVKKDGEIFPAMISASLLEEAEEGTPLITGTVTDISSNKEMEKILFHSQKMESIGQLAAGVAHDFNNMLSGIIGSTEILMDIFKENKEAGTYLEMIMEAADRSANLASNLLIFSQKKSVEMEWLDINNVIKQSVSILEKTTQRKIAIFSEDSSEEPTIWGNENLLQSIMINLGINASHAMPQGGNLFFRITNITMSEEDCSNSSFNIIPGRYIQLRVTDTGSGISEENIQRIFDPFFTTKAQGMGTGLGLSAVFGSVVLHRGSIKVKSSPGKGTEFTLLFPCINRSHSQE